jgi:hypothetical protein
MKICYITYLGMYQKNKRSWREYEMHTTYNTKYSFNIFCQLLFELINL